MTLSALIDFEYSPDDPLSMMYWFTRDAFEYPPDWPRKKPIIRWRATDRHWEVCPSREDGWVISVDRLSDAIDLIYGKQKLAVAR